MMNSESGTNVVIPAKAGIHAVFVAVFLVDWIGPLLPSAIRIDRRSPPP
jgi:hypothetical protein